MSPRAIQSYQEAKSALVCSLHHKFAIFRKHGRILLKSDASTTIFPQRSRLFLFLMMETGLWEREPSEMASATAYARDKGSTLGLPGICLKL